LIELTALPSIDEERWVPLVRNADVLLVSGGDALYLCHWMRECGLTDLLPSLDDTVWIGMSAGSMVMTPRIGKEFVGWRPPNADDDRTLGLVDFSIFPHLDHVQLPENTWPTPTWAAGLDCPSYAIDDETAISVVDGVDVVSKGSGIGRRLEVRNLDRPWPDGRPTAASFERLVLTGASSGVRGCTVMACVARS
jgi:dipeptidase E